MRELVLWGQLRPSRASGTTALSILPYLCTCHHLRVSYPRGRNKPMHGWNKQGYSPDPDFLTNISEGIKGDSQTVALPG